MKRVLDLITGETKCLEQRYVKLYGKNDYSHEIKTMKRSVLKKYVCFSAAVLLLFAATVVHGRLTDNTGDKVEMGEVIKITRPAEGEDALRIPMRLEAIWGEDEDEKTAKNVVLFIRPEAVQVDMDIEEIVIEDEAVNIELEMNRLVKSINRSDSGNALKLPKELSEGVELVWSETRDSRSPLLAPTFLLVIFVIYQNRYALIKKMENDAKEGIITELPDFINKLVLLLNAGLVFTSAFDRIIINYGGGGYGVKSYFYQQLFQIDRSVRETNSPLIAGLKEFASRSSVRELTRTVNIISDNIDKGSELASKLQSESELLWLTKKKLAEQKGRLAETKLTFPLVILLLALIMVTIAPALMEM